MGSLADHQLPSSKIQITQDQKSYNEGFELSKITFLQWLKLHLEEQSNIGRFARDIERVSGRPRGATGMEAWLTFVNCAYKSETMTSTFIYVWGLYRESLAE
jgi:hypothetical protein